VVSRYAIDQTSEEWAQAEAHVAKLADPAKRKDVSTVVSLKGSSAPKKRTADDEAGGQATKKKNRRSSKGSKK
jgi:hypothetical protein